ncbi:MAG: Zn-dependent alcohol dehydrogenase [Deltaproteobacteria bacterium]|nr:Zn-dependent alcohol dehydrogenase [Deltaproteobacteria bacterium]
MRAAVLHEVGKPLVVEDLEVDDPGPREVLVRTIAAGVCHSDYHYMNGSWSSDLPLALGHEASGVVEKVGRDVTYCAPGDHVISCLSVFCGSCRNCLVGKTYLCENTEALERRANEKPRLSLNGRVVHQGLGLAAFAEQMLLHENAPVKIRPEMPLDRAALIGCAVTTGVGSVIRTAAVEPGSTVAVIGCGGVGLSAISGAALAGASRIIAIDIHAHKLELARKFGATAGINAAETDPVAAVLEATGGGVDYAFEALGLKQTCEQAFAMLRPSGTACIIGMMPEGEKIEIDAGELLDDRRLIGSDMGSNVFRIDMPRFVEFYLNGRLNLDAMISQRVPLEKINEAYADMLAGSVARTVITFDGSA